MPTVQAHLKRTIEQAFTPLQCECSDHLDGSFSVKVFNSASGEVHLMVVGISSTLLNSSRLVSDLIAQLRSELADNMGRLQRSAQA